MKKTDEELFFKEPREVYKLILGGKIKRFPENYWNQPGVEDAAADITRYFMEDILKWKEEDIKNKTCEAVFRKYHLSGMLEYVFNRSPFKAVDNAYPGKFKAWELRCIPKGFWMEEENREQALLYLLDKTGKGRTDELANKDFIKYGLGGLMDYLIRNKSFILLENSAEERSICKDVAFFTSNSKSSRNLVRASVEIPVSMLKEIGVTKEEAMVNLKVEGKKIVIEKWCKDLE